MKRLLVLLLVSSASIIAVASPKSDQNAKLLYPQSQTDQIFVSKFFEILDLHKSKDPLLEGKGPSVAGFSLDEIKFAFMINLTDTTVDLAFYNWNLPVFKGLRKDESLSKAYGSNVFILKGIPKTAVASQGEQNDQLTNFSYMFGARYTEEQIRLNSPGFEVPEAMRNWKPHPNYMDRSHPLRKALDTQVLVLLSPSKDLAFGILDKAVHKAYEEYINGEGGFISVFLGLMIHEMFHVKEGEDNVNRLADAREIPEDRKALVAEIEADESLRALLSTYAKIVFSVGDSLKASKVTNAEIEKLQDLNSVIQVLRTKHPNAWAYIWNYEYTEGFAEYASAYSMIQGKVTSLAQEIDQQKDDINNFAYRTGAIGGLYLTNRIKKLPFDKKQDHDYSLWELVLQETETSQSAENIESIIKKYDPIEFDEESEIKKITEYLISTVMEL